MKFNIVDAELKTAVKISEIQNLTGAKLAEWNHEMQIAKMDDGTEWLVLTDDEADERVSEDIKNSLWAFRSEFILRHLLDVKEISCKNFERIVKSLECIQTENCESCNEFLYILIDKICGFDDFVDDAIDADGRGHFLSWYDGNEIETENFYCYRVN